MRYLRDKEFRMSVLISACVAAITAAAGFFLIRQQAAMAGFLLAVLGCVLVIALWLAFTLCRYRRLEKLAADTDRMLHGERDLNFTRYQEGELEILANELSKLLNRLSEQTDHLQAEKGYLSDSLADISHQLRTPLTSLNLVLARLGQETDPQERRKLLYEAGQLQGRISWLVEALLKISRIDAGTAVFVQEQVEVQKLMDSVLEPFAIPMELREQQVKLDIPAETAFTGDFSWSCEAVSNIVKNCMEHAGESGVLTLRAQENSLYTELVIEDNGPGIAPEELPHLFERFYKGKCSFGSGIGIGLALSRMIIKQRAGPGLRFASIKVLYKVTNLSPESHAPVICALYTEPIKRETGRPGVLHEPQKTPPRPFLKRRQTWKS